MRVLFVLILFFLLSSVAIAEEFKCVVKDNVGGQHIILVDTTDIKDAARAAGASTVKNHFGRPSPVVKVAECKLETESFSSVRSQAMDSDMPR